MPLKTQTMDVSFAGGLDKKTADKLVRSPHTVTADNVVYTSAGEVRKRTGYTALPRTIVGSGSLISAGTDIAQVGNELLLNDGTTLWSWSPQAQAWTSRGSTLNASVTATAVGPLGNAPGNVVSATIGNYVCVAYDSTSTPGFLPGGGNMYVGIFDLSKNAWLFPPVAPIAAGSSQMPGRPSVVAFGSYFYVFFMKGNTSGPTIAAQFYTINPAVFVSSGLVLAGPTNLGSGAVTPDAGATSIDAQTTQDGTKMVAAYTLNAGAGTPQAFKFLTPGGSYTAPILGLTAALGNGSISVAVNNLYAVFCTPTKVVAVDLVGFTTPGAGVALSFNSTYAKSIAPCLDTNSNLCLAAGTGVQGTSPNFTQAPGYVLGSLTGTAITLGAYQLYPWPNGPVPIQPLSKPFSPTNQNYFQLYVTCLGQFSRTLQGTVGILQLSGYQNAAATVVGRALYDVPTYQAPPATQPRVVSAPDALNGILALQGLTISELGPLASLVRLTTTAAGSAPILPLAQGALVAGARPQVYDGTTLSAAGYDAFPELPALTAINAGGGLMTPGATYFYTAVYLRTDAFGNRVMSAPAPVVSVFMGVAGNSVQTNGTTDWWPQYAGATLIIYRTTAADPLNFRELTTGAFFTDNTPDTALVANSAQYAFSYVSNGTTTELSNDPPPAYTVAAATQQRVFVVSQENPTRLYYSKPFNAGRPIEFNGGSYVTVDPATGPITALGYLDEKLVIFKASNMYVLGAEAGPDATGAGGFPTPLRLAVESGTSVPRSLVTTDAGLFYQSPRGIQVLNRTTTVGYSGAPIEGLLVGRTIQAAVYLPTPSQLRFFLDNGTALVYDAVVQRWSTFSNYSGVAATLYNGAEAFLAAGGAVNVENVGFTDNGTPITMTLETAWVPFASSQGWGRLRRVLVLGDYKSANTATLSFAYDWASTYVDNVQFSTAAGLLGGDTTYQWRARAPRQVMQAVRLKLVDTSTSGESYAIVGLLLETSIKSEVAKLPQAKSV